MQICRTYECTVEDLGPLLHWNMIKSPYGVLRHTFMETTPEMNSWIEIAFDLVSVGTLVNYVGITRLLIISFKYHLEGHQLTMVVYELYNSCINLDVNYFG